MQRSIPYRLLILFLVFTGVTLYGQTRVDNISIETKKNGAFLQIKTSKPVAFNNITGWIRKSSTFYLTILNAEIDSTRFKTPDLFAPVNKFDYTHVGESLQLMFELADTVESFEIYVSDNPAEILASLRFPLDVVFTDLQRERARLEQEPAIMLAGAEAGPSTTYGKVKTALYLTGASLTVAGVISQDNSDGMRWEFGTGLGLILGTYLFDKYIKPLLDD